MKYLIIALLFSFSAFGQEKMFTGEIRPINKGAPSPFYGFVITKQFEKNLRKKNEQNKLLRHKNLLLSDLSTTHKYMITLHKERAEKAHSELVKTQLKGMLWAIGGIFLGGAAVYYGSKLK